MRNFLNRKKTIFFSVLFICLLFWQSLTLSGFCYGDMTWLSNQEIADRYLLMQYSPKMSLKVASSEMHIKEIEALRKEHSGCCIVSNRFWSSSGLNELENSLLLNRHFFEVDEFVASNDKADKAEPYVQKETAVNACVTEFAEQWGAPLSAGEYDLGIKKINAFFMK